MPIHVVAVTKIFHLSSPTWQLIQDLSLLFWALSYPLPQKQVTDAKGRVDRLAWPSGDEESNIEQTDVSKL